MYSFLTHIYSLIDYVYCNNMLLILVGHRIAMLTVIQSHKVTLSNKAYSPG